MELLRRLHHRYVFLRRVRVLADEISGRLPADARVLDVGCGDGSVSRRIMDTKPGTSFQGIDVMARPACAIPFQEFDGRQIPFPSGSFDAVQLIDVLHHVPDEVIVELLREAARVSGAHVVIKDHLWVTRADFLTLKLMDCVGNAPHGVEVVYNYKTETFWRDLFRDLELDVVSMSTRLPLYPGIFQLLFGRGLHFVAVLRVKDRPA